MDPAAPLAPTPHAHSWFDDAHALIAGSLFVALGMTMFGHAGLLTGGVAGVAFLASYASGLAFGLLFFVFSLPFFALSWFRLGPAFTFKSFGAVALVSACTTLAPKVVRFELLNPWVASVLGGFLIGFGLLALLRHQASVGGVNILAQWLQQSRGFSAGKVQMGVDLVVVLAALMVVPPVRVAQSVVGAVAIGAILALNHRPGRYLGV
ncbi:MAG: YitT family protein [Hydrogenophaga sp.]|uniref:YitT family protein n=1 Tax=Hydrogenophaga sp. TaxID=1904254 RepID=UPI0025C0CB23|nr:YitT family protein [Hydrogenophaga sp.]MBT9553933.1 YitT family protein [Hydrogenophaga sp.]